MPPGFFINPSIRKSFLRVYFTMNPSYLPVSLSPADKNIFIVPFNEYVSLAQLLGETTSMGESASSSRQLCCSYQELMMWYIYAFAHKNMYAIKIYVLKICPIFTVIWKFSITIYYWNKWFTVTRKVMCAILDHL